MARKGAVIEVAADQAAARVIVPIVGIDEEAPAARQRQRTRTAIVGKAFARQDDGIARAGCGQHCAAVDHDAAARGRTVVDRADRSAGDVAQADVAAGEVGFARAAAQMQADRARASVDEAARAEQDFGRPRIAVRIDHAIGEQVIGDDGDIAIVGRDARVDQHRAPGLERQRAAIARRIVDGDCVGDGDVVVRLEHQACAGIEDVGDGGRRDGDAVTRRCAIGEGGRARTAQSEEIDCARIVDAVSLPVVIIGAHREPPRVERDAAPKTVAAAQLREAEVVGAQPARAEPRDFGPAGKLCVGKGEQIDRARSQNRILKTAVVRRADRQPVAIERNRYAELVVGLQIGDIDILAAGISLADNGLHRRGGKDRIGEAEQINGPDLRQVVGRTPVGPRTDGEPVAVERHAVAELVVGVQIGDIVRAGAHVILADGARQRRRCKGRVGKGEKINGARAGRGFPESVVAGRANREPVAVERYAPPETVADGEVGHRKILAAGIADPDPGLQCRRGEAGVGKAEQIYRAAVVHAVRCAVVGRCADRQPVAVERHRRGKNVGGRQRADRKILAAAIAKADDGLQRRCAERRTGKGEEIDGTGAAGIAQRTRIARRPNRQPIAAQRNTGTKKFIRNDGRRTGQVDRRIGAIARAQCPAQRALGEQRVAEGEEIDGPSIGRAVGRTIVKEGADRQSFGVDRNGEAEQVVCGDFGYRPVLAAYGTIACAKGCLERGRGEQIVGKCHQIDRARISRRIAAPIVARRTNGEAQAVERDRSAETVAGLDVRQVEILAPRIAGPIYPGEGRGCETGIGKGEEIDRARV